jgi:peptidoglycan/xylan/chitin deacetylase (PgdA/CDA1 family)
MTRNLKLRALRAMKGCRVLDLVAGSRWRHERLLILCYHGISLRDEHEWSHGLYMSPSSFDTRLETICSGGYRVVPLAEGLRRLKEGTLAPRSVAITFDDGLYDFYAQAWPRLRRYGFPATVYLTTYYSDYNRPIFRLICDYMIWQRRGSIFGQGNEAIDLRTPESRATELNRLDMFAKENKLSAREKDRFAEEFAARIGADWQAILRDRLIHIMTGEEAAEAARGGIDLQLHTHRHLTPRDEKLFRRELDNNEVRIARMTGEKPVHFCYPSGVHYPEYLDWLRNWGVKSAVTCEPGMVENGMEPLLLPRFCDHGGVEPIEFEGWLSGLQHWLPRRRYQAVDPD